MQIIEKVIKKIKTLPRYKWFDELLWGLVVFLCMVVSFGLGMKYQYHQSQIQNPIQVQVSPQALELWNAYQSSQNSGDAGYFASKNGSVVYPVGCSAGNRVNDENKIFFAKQDEAVALGYRPSEQC